MPELKRCRACGVEMQSNAPFGHCPRCLLKMGFGLASNDEPPEEESPGEREQAAASFFPPAGAKLRYFGDYELQEPIGRGGMGVVYKAQQISLRRSVAIKMISAGELASPSAVQRFHVEAEAAAKLDHPNIVPIYEIGVHQGQHYFSMKLVEGGSLEELMRRSSISIRDAALLLACIARAIHYAHQRGVIHRDLKPGNILIDERGEPHVTDFGLAKILGYESGVTRTAEMLGTPSYMSPEQVAGRSLTTATDVWGLGIVFYELLTGRLPFRAENTPALLRKIAEEEPGSFTNDDLRFPRRLGSAAVTDATPPDVTIANRKSQIENAIGRDLETICLKCLEKDPERRYASAAALADDLDRWQRDEPVLARRSTLFERLIKWTRRQPLLAAAVVLLHVVLLLGIGGVVWQWRRAERHANEESHQRQRAEAGLRRAESAEQQMRESLRAAYLAEAQARRVGTKAGRNFESLAAIQKAAAIRPDLDLRNEAIACMVLPDLRSLGHKRFRSAGEMVAVDCDHGRFAVADETGAILVVRLADGRELARLPAVGPRIDYPSRFSRDGKYVGFFYADQRLRVWDWTNATVRLDVPGRCTADITADGVRLATLDEGNIVVYDLIRGKLLKTIAQAAYTAGSADNDFEFHFRFHPEGRLLAVSSRNQSNVLIVDTELGITLKNLPHPKQVYETSWHPGGQYLACGGSDHLIHVWDTVTGEKFRTMPRQAISVAFGRGGGLLATSDWAGETSLWDFPAGRLLATFAENGRLSDFSSDDAELTLSDWDAKGLEPVQVATGGGLRTIFEQDHGADNEKAPLSFSADGKLLAYTTAGGVRLWDLEASREVGVLNGDLTVLGFDRADENLLLTGSSNIFRWPVKPLATAAPVVTPASTMGPWPATQADRRGWISSDGLLCAVLGSDRCQIYRTEGFTEQARTGVQPGMRFVTVSPDGSLLVSGAWKHRGVKVWDTRTGNLMREFQIKTAVAENAEFGTSVAFSPDGRRLVTSVAGEFHFWDVSSWTLTLHIPQSGEHLPATMAFSPDGRILAASASKSLVRLHEASTGNVLAVLEPPNLRRVSGLAFSPDGSQLAVCGALVTIHLWDLRLIRHRLAAMNLDWALPPYPPQDPAPTEH